MVTTAKHKLEEDEHHISLVLIWLFQLFDS